MESSLSKPSISMFDDISHDLVRSMLSLAVGAISFGASWWTLSLSIAFPVLLFRTETRTGAFLVALSYHLGATKSLAFAAGNFFSDDTGFGILLWAVGNFLNAALYSLLWQRKPSVRILTIPLALCLTAIPPFGVLGWANPLTAAGVIFPGSGVLGFGYLMGLYFCLAQRLRSMTKIFFILSLWCFITAPKLTQSPIAAISTNFHRTEDNGRGDYERQQKLKSEISKMKQKIILLPEGIVTGGWTEVGEKLWEKEKKTVLIGANDLSGRPQNIIALVSGGTKYLQRQPVPFSMWRPFDKDSFSSNWFTGSVIDVKGLKVAPLICYEGFLVWPIVHSNLSGAKYIAVTGNYWWARDSEIPKIHESIIKSWSRLFSMPYSIAVNL